MRKMIIVLTAVMALSGLVLAATYSGLSPKIEQNRVAALNASLAAIFTGSGSGGGDGSGRGDASGISFEQLPTDKATIYRGTSGSGNLLGYAVRLQAQGYGGAVTLLVGLSPDLETIQGIEVVEQSETPGLGGRITTDWFKSQFVGLAANTPISYVKNADPVLANNEIEAISGATITSRAVVTGINASLAPAIALIRQAQ